ncbi:MAG: GNAT family N-acetyltransferase [Pseudomonadales bacterium]
MEYALRGLLVDELEWLYELNKEVYQEVVVRQFGEWDEAFQRDVFFTKWEGVRPAQIIELDGRRIGVVILERKAEYHWLQEIQIATSHQGNGLGTAILKKLIETARLDGIPLRLQVLHENHRAKRLYERLGFQELGKQEHHYLMEVS